MSSRTINEYSNIDELLSVYVENSPFASCLYYKPQRQLQTFDECKKKTKEMFKTIMKTKKNFSSIILVISFDIDRLKELIYFLKYIKKKLFFFFGIQTFIANYIV